MTGATTGDESVRVDVTGAVLTGGASRRMGTDKAFVVVDGTAMVERVAGSMRTAGCRPVFAVGGDAAALAAAGFECVADRWPGEGPLGGIVTAVGHAAGPVFVSACDLPWLDAATIEVLLERYRMLEATIDVVVARTERIEPLCAIWSQSASVTLQAAFGSGERAVHRVLANMRVESVDVDPSRLVNVNTPGDLIDRADATARYGDEHVDS